MGESIRNFIGSQSQVFGTQGLLAGIEITLAMLDSHRDVGNLATITPRLSDIFHLTMCSTSSESSSLSPTTLLESVSKQQKKLLWEASSRLKPIDVRTKEYSAMIFSFSWDGLQFSFVTSRGGETIDVNRFVDRYLGCVRQHQCINELQIISS